MLQTHPNIWRFIHTFKNEEQHLTQKNIHQLMGNTCGFAATTRKRAKQAVKKTCQIIKLYRLFAENKKTFEQFMFGLSFLVGEPVSKKKTKENKKPQFV